MIAPTTTLLCPVCYGKVGLWDLKRINRVEKSIHIGYQIAMAGIQGKSLNQSSKFSGSGLSSNQQWKMLEDLVIKLYNGKTGINIEIADSELAKIIREHSVTAVIDELTSIKSVLVRGSVVLRSNVKESDDHEQVVKAICMQWELFHRRVLPKVQAVFAAATVAHKLSLVKLRSPGVVNRGKSLDSPSRFERQSNNGSFNIRELAIEYFRDYFFFAVLKRAKSNLLQEGRPPRSIMEMLLVLERSTSRADPKSESAITLGQLLKRNNIPFLASRNKNMGGELRSVRKSRSPLLGRSQSSATSVKIPSRSHKRSPSDTTISLANLARPTIVRTARTPPLRRSSELKFTEK